jgi:hypothetical protein
MKREAVQGAQDGVGSRDGPALQQASGSHTKRGIVVRGLQHTHLESAGHSACFAAHDGRVELLQVLQQPQTQQQEHLQQRSGTGCTRARK